MCPQSEGIKQQKEDSIEEYSENKVETKKKEPKKVRED